MYAVLSYYEILTFFLLNRKVINKKKRILQLKLKLKLSLIYKNPIGDISMEILMNHLEIEKEVVLMLTVNIM